MPSQPLQAPELRVPYWINKEGQEMETLSLADLGTGFKVIFCFKASCPGCHARGFPTLQKLVESLHNKEFGFAVVHTAFDDDPQNSQDRIKEMQLKYKLKIPFGHDPKNGAEYPTFMQDYRTRGTPYFIVINPNNEIVFSDFSLDADKLIEAFSQK